MTRSLADPRPVPIRKYRYSKLRWRVLVHLLDAVGDLAVGLFRRVQPLPAWGHPRKILVVQLDHLGDSVLSSPLFPLLKSAYPEARIEVLASPSNQAVFEADPNVDRVHLASRNWFERKPGRWALASAVWSLGRTLRGQGYDLGIDVRGDVLSVLVLALARIPRRLGWTMGGGGFLLTDRANWVPGRHEVESRLALLEPLGLEVPGERPRVSVHATDRDRARVARMLREAWPDQPLAERSSKRIPELAAVGAESGRQAHSSSRVHRRHGGSPVAETHSGPSDAEADWLHAGRFGESAPLLAVHLGAGTAAKRWPISHWRNLLDRFFHDGWRVVVVGGPDDIGMSRDLEPHPDLQDWSGRLAVTETTALLERADLFVGADSGPAHLAACAGVPSVILFSGTNRVTQWRPWSRVCLVLRQDVPCRPCHRKVCPLSDHPCMNGITPERVHEEARRWWAQRHYVEPAHAPR